MTEYKRVDANDIETIRRMINDDTRVIYDTDISEDYGHDELGGIFSLPDVVVKILSAKEASDIMTHRKHLVAVDEEWTLKETMEFILQDIEKCLTLLKMQK